MRYGGKRRVVNKAASYTVNPSVDSPCTLFTTLGATGAIVFTLPTPNIGQLGVEYDFLNLVNQDMTVAPPAVDTLVATNDLTADSVAASTTNEKLGALLRATCIETTAGSVFRWFVVILPNGITSTIAT